MYAAKPVSRAMLDMRSDSDDFEEGAEDEMSEYDQELSSEES